MLLLLKGAAAAIMMKERDIFSGKIIYKKRERERQPLFDDHSKLSSIKSIKRYLKRREKETR